MKEEVKEKRVRLAELDILKAVAVLLVVFGHLLECFSAPLNGYFYKGIYLFHIPVLVYLSGRLAKPAWKKAVGLLLPLALFQLLYALFVWALGGRFSLSMMPYWLLWYLLSLCGWRCSLYAVQRIGRRWRWVFFLASIALAILVGFLPFMGRVLSLSRTVCFYPFFLLGYFHQRKNPFAQFSKAGKGALWLGAAVAVAAFLACKDFFANEALYLASAYGGEGHGVLQRICVFVGAFAVVLAASSLSVKRRCLPAELVAKNSMSPYLLHGFLVVAIKMLGGLPNDNGSILWAFLLSAAVTVLFSTLSWGIKKMKKFFK